eukprot:TRINITY_DN1721_c0_g1_i2.p1 TRINITY_DN1721_c0_g1~~TRINITY_DN1721_c0_g1_i2.p1  ORF type:complete len:147 (-),score=12.37 TRINITY_DN1721_c0_g1_i2:44-484(-)
MRVDIKLAKELSSFPIELSSTNFFLAPNTKHRVTVKMIPSLHQVDCQSQFLLRWGREKPRILGKKYITLKWSVNTSQQAKVGYAETKWSLTGLGPIFGGLLLINLLSTYFSFPPWLYFGIGLLSMYFQLYGNFYVDFLSKFQIKLN